MKTILKKYLFPFLSFNILAYYIVFPFFQGGDYIFREGDLLDSVGPLCALMESGHFFNFNPNFIIDQLLNGMPRAFYPSPFFITHLIIYAFGLLYGLFVNNALIRILGFIGMFALLKRYLLKDSRHEGIVWVVSTLFACLPLFPLFGLGIWGFPMLFYAVINIYYNGITFRDSLLIIVFSFYSFLYHTGIFMILLLTLSIIYFILKERKINWKLFYVLCILSFGYAIVEYMTVASVFFEDFATHRSARIPHHELLGFTGIINKMFNLLLNGRYHAASYYGHSILFIATAALTIGIWRKVPLKSFVMLFSSLFIIAFASASLHYSILSRFLYDNFQFIRMFDLTRINFFLSFLIFILLSLSLKIIYDIHPVIGKYALLFIFLFLSYKSARLDRYFRGITHYSQIYAPNQDKSFNNFFSSGLMREIDNDIHFKKNTFNIIHLGIYPAVTQCYGGRTIDIYANSYPLKHKMEFRKIIEKELEKDERLRMSFDNWGNQCYAVARGNVWENGNNKCNEGKGLTLEWNIEQLKKMNCKYVFSICEIINTEELKFKLVSSYQDDNSFWKKIFVYEVF